MKALFTLFEAKSLSRRRNCLTRAAGLIAVVLIAVVTEMLGAQAGLGLLIYQAVVQVDFVQVWAAVFVASAASLLFFGLVSFIERRMVFWK